MRGNWNDEICPVACALTRVGDMWGLLILRDAISGLTRFEEFQHSLDIATNVLTRRLSSLVEAGLLEKRLFRERPARYEYVVTDAGRQYRKAILVLLEIGRQFSTSCRDSLDIVEVASGRNINVDVVDAASGISASSESYRIVAGVNASDPIRYRFAYISNKQRGNEPGGRYRPPKHQG